MSVSGSMYSHIPVVPSLTHLMSTASSISDANLDTTFLHRTVAPVSLCFLAGNQCTSAKIALLEVHEVQIEPAHDNFSGSRQPPFWVVALFFIVVLRRYTWATWSAGRKKFLKRNRFRNLFPSFYPSHKSEIAATALCLWCLCVNTPVDVRYPAIRVDCWCIALNRITQRHFYPLHSKKNRRFLKFFPCSLEGMNDSALLDSSYNPLTST